MTESISEHFRKMDWVMILSAVGLVLAGLLAIYSSSFFRSDFLNFKKQVFFLFLGFLLMLAVSFFDWRLLRDQPYLVLMIYFLSLFSLAFLFIFAPLIKGVKSWYRLGIFALDPVPLVKIVVIILLAKYFSLRHIEMYRFKHILVSGAYVFPPFLLIFLQPDLGGAAILFFIWLGILIASGIEIKHFFILLLIVSLASFVFWHNFFKPYQKERVISFLAPESEPLGKGWSQRQSTIAIGSGGLYGQGFRQGTQLQLGFLSLPQTDFVFSALAEEFGLLGIATVFFLLAIVFLKIMKISFEAKSNFPRLFALGVALMLCFETFVHAGMNLGILPVIGLPLPFVSYGGSGLVFNFIALGVLQSLKIYQEK